MMPVRRMVTAAMCAVLLSGTAGVAYAQDATPVTGIDSLLEMNAVESEGLDNALYAGTCAEFKPEAVAQLAPASFRGMSFLASGGIVAGATPEAAMSALAVPVAVGTSVLDLGIAQIVDGGHALVVANPMNDATPLACGVVGGETDRDGNLFVGIEPMNDSGVWGVAWLNEQDGKSTVTVMLARPFFVSNDSSGQMDTIGS